MNKNSFETPLMNMTKFNGYKNIEVHFNTQPKHVFKYQIDNILAAPEKKFKLPNVNRRFNLVPR